jgi:hypothetical protein
MWCACKEPEYFIFQGKLQCVIWTVYFGICLVGDSPATETFVVVIHCYRRMFQSYVRQKISMTFDFTFSQIKSKRIPSIFNDKSTESFICLRRHIFKSHVNKVQPIRVKIICIAAIRVTCMKNFISVVKLLLKAFFFCSLFLYPPPHNTRSMHLIV